LSESNTPTSEFLYVYCVVDGMVNDGFGKIGMGGRGDEVYAWSYEGISAIVSRTDQHVFERNEENVLAHQRVIQKVFSRFVAVPLPFSTILESETELKNFLANRWNEFRDKLVRLREIVQPANPEPGLELVEEALAQSFASALTIRQLADEVSKLQAAPTAKPDQSSIHELTSEVRSVKEELQALRSMKELLADAVEKTAAAKPELSRESAGSGELREQVNKLRSELDDIRRIQLEIRHVTESADEMLKGIMGDAGIAEKSEKPGKTGATYA
jgi:DNA repair exonuclease SbcCD ATPase subunit